MTDHPDRARQALDTFNAENTRQYDEGRVPDPVEAMGKALEGARFYFVHRSELEGMADTDPDEGYVALVDADELQTVSSQLALSEELRERGKLEYNRMLREAQQKLDAAQGLVRDVEAERDEARSQLSSHREALRELREAADEATECWPESCEVAKIDRLIEALAKARALLSEEEG